MIAPCYNLVPQIPPSNIKVEADSPTKLRVSWDLMTPDEAQGFVVSYTVSYKKEELLSDEGLQKTVPEDRNSLFIDDLDSNQGYSIVMWANTTAGMGEPSKPISTKSMSHIKF